MCQPLAKMGTEYSDVQRGLNLNINSHICLMAAIVGDGKLRMYFLFLITFVTICHVFCATI